MLIKYVRAYLKSFLSLKMLNTEICIPSSDIVKLSRVMRKPDLCLGENKGADQLRGNR